MLGSANDHGVTTPLVGSSSSCIETHTKDSQGAGSGMGVWERVGGLMTGL
jgi:hypothetical protein